MSSSSTQNDNEVKNDDLSTATSESKLEPNSLLVGTVIDRTDNSVVWLSHEKMDELGLFRGDTVLIKSHKRRNTICIVLEEERCPKNNILMSRVIRKNLLVRLGDVVSIDAAPNVPYGERIQVLPIADTIGNFTGNLFEVFLKPYFVETYRPVTKGDIFSINGSMHTIEFKVIGTDPSPACIVAPDTLIHFEGDPISREDAEENIDYTGYDSIGGISKQLAQIREIVEMSFSHLQSFKLIGIEPPRGILLYGPPGTGKTLIARAVANETGAFLFLLDGPEIISKEPGESESTLRKVFAECEKNSPAILFIDEIDVIIPKREKIHGETERRVVSQLLALMDGLKKRKNVIVMAATTRPNEIDPAFRRCGRFDREIKIDIPDAQDRLEILRIHTNNMRLDKDVDLKEIADKCHGYVGADLKSLCTEAYMQKFREKTKLSALKKDTIDEEALSSVVVNMENFRFAMSEPIPLALREAVAKTLPVNWIDIDVLEHVGYELQELVYYSVEHSDKYLKLGIKPPRGVVFYGPGGCDKTSIAKSIAQECQINFISKDSEMLKMELDDLEIDNCSFFKEIFTSAPCVFYINGLELITNNCIFNQILAKIDDVGLKKKVFIIGATSHPHTIDFNMLRLGCIDQLIYIPLPDESSRLNILKTNLLNTPIAKNVDLDFLARNTVGYSSNDLTELCQQACKFAIRENVVKYCAQRKENQMRLDRGESAITEHLDDPVPEITHDHFVKAMQLVCRSVSDDEICTLETFALSLHQSRRFRARSTQPINSFDDDLYN